MLNNGTNADIVTTNLTFTFLPATPEVFLYDPDGNLTNDGRFAYTWDAENRLLTITSPTNIPAAARRKLTFEYDWAGRRIRMDSSRWTNNNWFITDAKKFCYDGWNLVAELNATNNALLRSYGWGLDVSGSFSDAGGVGALLWVNDAVTQGSNTTHLVSYDGNGNVSSLVHAGDGALSAKYEYGPFGDLIQASGPMARANPIRWSSKYQDNDTSLIYYGYRFYSPSLQRWLNRDPSEEQGGLNLYAFVGNDGINGADFLGRWNLWNPATWGDANAIGWSFWDSFNPAHESSGYRGNGDFFRQSLASATGWNIFGDYDPCDQLLADWRGLGRLSTMALEIFGPAKLAQWGLRGEGLLRTAAAVTGSGVELYQSAAATYVGYLDIQAGNKWGYAEMALGLLGLRGGLADLAGAARQTARLLDRIPYRLRYDFSRLNSLPGGLFPSIVRTEASLGGIAAKTGTQLEFGFIKNLENPNFVLYKAKDFNPSMLRPGEYTLNLPNLRGHGMSSAQAEALNWAQNQQALQRAMNIGNPIREANPLSTGGFLQRERDFLGSGGWQRTQHGSDVFWVKPSGQ